MKESEKLIKKIIISSYGQSLIAIVTNEDKTEDTILGRNVEEINRKLDILKNQQHKSFDELVKEKIIVIDPEKRKFIMDNFTFDKEGHITKNNSDTKKPEKASSEEAKAPEEVKTSPEAVSSDFSKVNEDGSIDVTENEEEKNNKRNRRSDKYKSKEKKKSKGIKKFKVIGATALAAIVIAGAGRIGYRLAGGTDNVVKNNFSSQDDKYEVTVTYDGAPVGYLPGEPGFEQNITGNPAPYDQDSATYGSLGTADYSDSMEDQLNYINEVCFYNIPQIYNFMNGQPLEGSVQSCNLHNLVVESDRDAVREMVNLRNMVVQNAYNSRNTTLTRNDVINVLNQYINYVFEGGNSINGRTVKSYYSLSPYSQYVITVLGQSLLQLCPDYSYKTTNNSYNFENLSSTFEGMSNITYSSLIQKSGVRK